MGGVLDAEFLELACLSFPGGDSPSQIQTLTGDGAFVSVLLADDKSVQSQAHGSRSWGVWGNQTKQPALGPWMPELPVMSGNSLGR